MHIPPFSSFRRRRLTPLVQFIGNRPPKGARPPLAPLQAQIRANRKAAKRPPYPNKILQRIELRKFLAKSMHITNNFDHSDDLGLPAFENALRTHPDAQSFLADRDAAVRLYRALCNQAWVGPDGQILTVSWRTAGDIVADARGQGEDYLDFYCSGGEGEVAADVQALLETLGWSPCPYPS